MSVSICVSVPVCVVLAGYMMEWVSLSHSDSREGPQAWLQTNDPGDMVFLLVTKPFTGCIYTSVCSVSSMTQAHAQSTCQTDPYIH